MFDNYILNKKDMRISLGLRLSKGNTEECDRARHPTISFIFSMYIPACMNTISITQAFTNPQKKHTERQP